MSTSALDSTVAPAQCWARPRTGDDGEHGDGHATRVLVWANLIALDLLARGIAVDLTAVRWAAVLHDTQRLNDGVDPGHGPRVAELIADGAVPVLADLPAETRRRIAVACAWHTRPAALADPPPELIALVDADRLDLVRYGLLNRSRLVTRAARDLTGPARRLWQASTPADRDAARARVRQQAVSDGWWRDHARHRPADRCCSC